MVNVRKRNVYVKERNEEQRRPKIKKQLVALDLRPSETNIELRKCIQKKHLHEKHGEDDDGSHAAAGPTTNVVVLVQIWLLLNLVVAEKKTFEDSNK